MKQTQLLNRVCFIFCGIGLGKTKVKDRSQSCGLLLFVFGRRRRKSRRFWAGLYRLAIYILVDFGFWEEVPVGGLSWFTVHYFSSDLMPFEVCGLGGAGGALGRGGNTPPSGTFQPRDFRCCQFSILNCSAMICTFRFGF